LPPRAQLIRLEGAVLLSALKRSEDGGKLVVRFVTQTPQVQPVTLGTYWGLKRVQRTDLRERALADLSVQDGETVQLDAQPWEIVTLALEVT